MISRASKPARNFRLLCCPEIGEYKVPLRGQPVLLASKMCACLLLSLEATILSVSLLTKLSLGYLQLHVTAILVSARCPMREGLKIPRYRVPSAWADLTWPDLLKSPANDMCFRVWDEDFFYTFLTISHYPGDSLMVRPPLRKSLVRLRTAPHGRLNSVFCD